MDEKFKLVSNYEPAGDQPQAIEQIIKGLDKKKHHQTILGVTGSGKTYTMAKIIEKIQKPTLIIAHNKTLAAQLCTEFQEFFPENAVSYFVSYYDYYQPEAYMPASDTYIEKDAQINQEIDRLRHAATMNLLTRKDVLIISSVSCIYGLGRREDYEGMAFELKVGQTIERDTLLRKLTDLQYSRAKNDFRQGMFEVMGDIIEVILPGKETAYRLEFFGDDLDKISEIDPFLGEIVTPNLKNIWFFPAKHSVTTPEKILKAGEEIRKDLEIRCKELNSIGKMLEAARLRQRTEYDLEMLNEVGYVNGIENYTRYLSGQKEGEPPSTLLDFFPKDFITFIDESHITVPQIGGMFNGNLSRKNTLVEYGFRLPSAKDNRPLKFEEFEKKQNQVVYVSATPGKYEYAHTDKKDFAELVVRPTGLIDPEVEVRKTEHQIDNLIEEINKTRARNERTLVTTLTKRSAEELTDYLVDAGLKVKYLHSDIDTIERLEILQELRLGEIEIVVGINLLREGLDLPEVSFIAILDADKEGFLRSRDALIQTIGRAARNVNGHVVLYADRITKAMKEAIGETDRRRKKQVAYNKKHGITPQTIQKAIKDMTMGIQRKKNSVSDRELKKIPKEEIPRLIRALESKMQMAVEELNFEKATTIRDEIAKLNKLKSS